jgi:tetratricopeptide (TPR) repeat protein
MGDYGRAATLLQHAADSFRLAPGGDNKKLALALASLGRCQSFTGRVADGMSNARLGLDIARRLGDPETLAICLISMGKACNFYGLEAAEAVPYFREAVDVYRKLGNNPVALADCLPSIAGSDSEAIPLIREALALHRQHLGPDHPKVASNLDSLGQVLLAHGDYEEAEHVLRETVALYRKIYDASYPYHRSTRRTLAAAIVMQQKWDEAELVARQAVDPTSPDGIDWDLLGRINAYRGRWSAAAEQLGRAIERNPGMDMYRAAVALVAAGQEEPYRQLCRRFFENYSTDSPDGARALAFLLGPVDGEQRTNLEQLVESTYYTKMGPLVASRGRLDKALTMYRLGRYQPALDAASPAVVDGARLPNQAQAWFIQALAGARLQRIESARTALAQGDKLLGDPQRSIHGDFLEDSFDWRIAEFLRAEAAKLLGISVAAPSMDAASPP